MKSIDVYTDGKFIYGYEVTYRGHSQVPRSYQVGHHIGGHIDIEVKCHTFNFEEGEYISGLTVASGDIVDRLEFTTNQGRSFKAGGPGGSSIPAKIAEGARVVALGGGIGGHMHHFKIFYLSL